MHATVVQLSDNSLMCVLETWEHRDLRANRAAVNSSLLMCQSASVSVQVPPVVIPLHSPPHPIFEASDFTTMVGFTSWTGLEAMGRLSIHHWRPAYASNVRNPGAVKLPLLSFSALFFRISNLLINTVPAEHLGGLPLIVLSLLRDHGPTHSFVVFR